MPTPSSSETAPSDSPPALELQVEAALLTSDRPLSAARLAAALGAVSVTQIQEATTELNRIYANTGRSFRIERVAGGWQVLTLPDYQPVIAALHKARAETRLTPAALETLAIIAYRQPILRAQVEAIRGVASGEVIRGLMERQLVKIVGRSDEIGRPMLYGSTKRFLEVFGLADLKDLPPVDQLEPKG